MKLNVLTFIIGIFLVACSTYSEAAQPAMSNNKMEITIGDNNLTATLADNSSAAALLELLKDGSVTVLMHDYGNFEKVGNLPTTLPRNDQNITTEAGDIILYQGNSIVIYYDHNTWNFTRLGKIDNITQNELKSILGSGNITATFSLQGAGTNDAKADISAKNDDIYSLSRQKMKTTDDTTHGIYIINGKKIIL